MMALLYCAAVGAHDCGVGAMAKPNIGAVPTQSRKDPLYLCDGENEMGE